jgi:putative Mg2+ transporter-C (MgtC) family protein
MDFMLKELDFFNQITSLHCFIKLLMAAVCGSIIGIERELHRKSAGIRTNMMICLGAALYVIAAEMILGLHAGGDATRMAGQVVVGMGFIGAGAIIQSRGHIIGLTTAATLWVVAAIGVVIGLGFPIFGLAVTLFVVGILVGVGWVEHIVLGKCRLITTRISFRDDTSTLGEIEALLSVFGKNLTQFKMTREGNICFMDVTYCTVHPDHSEWFYDLLKIPDVRQTTWHG